jgi:MFS family permease
VGLLAGVFGGMGALAGGTIADRLSKRDLRWYMWTPAIAMFAHVPIGLSQYLVASPYVSFAIGAFSAFLTTIYMGPFLATIQSLVTANMRATTQAVILMVLNIFGLSLGPFLVGVISDLFNFRLGLGVDSLRYAVCIAVMFNLWASFHFFFGSRYLKEDMARDRSQDGK